jgi:hypothetical protein
MNVVYSFQGNLAARACAGPALSPVIAQEAAQPLRFGIESLEEVFALLSLILELAGPQCLCERAPKPIPVITHFQNATNVRWFGAIEEEVRINGVTIKSVLALQHPQGY